MAMTLMGKHHVNRVEAPRQTVCPALLAADQCVHDLHAGELGKYHERCPLDYRVSYGPAYWTPGRTVDFHACGETLRASIRQCADRWRPDDVGRRLLAHESLPYPLCRAHRDGGNFRSLDACGLISLRRPRATTSGGVGSGFRTAYPLTFRARRAERKETSGEATLHDRRLRTDIRNARRSGAGVRRSRMDRHRSLIIQKSANHDLSLIVSIVQLEASSGAVKRSGA